MGVSSLKEGTYTYNGLEQLAIRVTTNQTPAGTTHFIHDIFGVTQGVLSARRHRGDGGRRGNGLDGDGA